MKLYRIKKSKTPEYFLGWRGYDSEQMWSRDGAFFKLPQTIETHLYLLASKSVMHGERRTFQNPLTGIGYDRRKIKNYKVVITEVLQSGSKTMVAEKFLKEFCS